MMKTLTLLILAASAGCAPLQLESLQAAYRDKEECEALAAEAPAGRKALEVKNECLRERQRSK